MTTVRLPEASQRPVFASPVDEFPSVDAAKTQVILVDDDANFREAASFELEDMGFQVTAVADGESLIRMLDEGAKADVIVLDWYLRSETGLDTVPKLRRRGVSAAIVLLTGVALNHHEAAALDSGALDFVDKAKGIPILARRIRLIVEGARGKAPVPQDDITHGDLVVRPKVCRAVWNGFDVGLTVTEFNIVHLLIQHAGEYVTYRTIYDCVRGIGFFAGSGDDGYRTNVRSSIKRIRSKFNAVDSAFDEIENFPAFGYQWRKHAISDFAAQSDMGAQPGVDQMDLADSRVPDA